MNKALRIIALIGCILFLLSHYVVMSIDKEYFPMFAHLYPFIAKFWFEASRLLLIFNWHIDISILFSFIKYILLINVAFAMFAFKYPFFYRVTIFIMIFLLSIYLVTLIFLGLTSIYPIYTFSIAMLLILSFCLMKLQRP